MATNHYLLYLDECMETNLNSEAYGILGVMINKSELTNVRQELGELKINLWDSLTPQEAKNIVLHATDIHSANRRRGYRNPKYSIFRTNKKVNDAFLGVKDIVLNNNLVVMGCVLDKKSIRAKYKTQMSHYLSDSICLKNIINNFACFLKFHEATGEIIFESRSSSSSEIGDAKIKKLFYKTMSHGTDIYKPLDLQSVIDGITFIKKQENDAGLQIADCIAQPFIYNFCGKKQKTPNIYKDVRKRRYSGELTYGEQYSNIFGVTHIR